MPVRQSLLPDESPPPWLEALPDSAAVIDQGGTIIAVNALWGAGARGNGGALQGGPGENYPGMCRDAPGAEVRDLARLLTAVLDGTSSSLEWEYPCHSPPESRWFQLSANRFQDHGRCRVLLVHRDITGRRLDEGAASDPEQPPGSVLPNDSEDLFKRSSQVARVGGWETDLASGELSWTSVTRDILEVDRAEAAPPLDDALPRFYKGESYQTVRANLEHAIDHGVAADFETELETAKGRTKWVRIQAEPEIRGGETARLLGTFQDITEHHATEQRLRQYHHLIESGSDLFCIIDADHRYVFANDGYAAVYGLSAGTIEGLHVTDVVSVDFYEQEAAPRIDRCLAGESLSFESKRTYPDQDTRHFLIRYFPVAAISGSQRNVGAVLTDITDIRQAEQQLREQSQLLDMAGRVARFGGWWIDLDNCCVHWSAMVAEIHAMPRGYSPTVEEALAFYAPEYRETLSALFEACSEQGVAFDREMEIIDAHGERVWVRVVAEPVRDADGRISSIQGAFQDISARKEATREFERLNTRLANVVESISDAFYTLTPDWRFDYVNSAAGRLLGCDPGELLGREMWTAFPAAVDTRIEHEYRRAVREGATVAFENYYSPLDTWFDIRAYPTDEGLAVYFRDVTERHTMEAQLREQEKEIRVSRDALAATLETRQMLVNALPAHIAMVDAHGTILDVNQQWRQFGVDNANPDPDVNVGSNYLAICDAATGEWAEEAAVARAGLAEVLSGARETFVLEYPCHAPDEARWFRMMANRLGDDPASGAVVMHVDITERRLAEQERNRLAYEDALTGLPSRNGFLQALADRLGPMDWQPEAMIIMFDIHRHRDINDSHGYAVGDRLLQAVAERMDATAGEEALAGRLGGDEFAVFLPGHPDRTPRQTRESIAAVFEEPFLVDDLQLDVRARFGYTLFEEQPRAHEQLLREAELALFESTGDGSNDDWTAYSSAIDNEKRHRIEITRELRQALAGNEFELHFQPKVELETGALVSGEALLRWYHPEDGLRSPATFITIAEQSQLIGPIGDWVLEEACRHLHAWKQAHLDVVRVAVNVSLVQFMVGDFPATVRAALRRYDVSPAALTLEITESVFERESESLNRQMCDLHDMGVRLSLDDFGTGYSSLLYLQQYPFDEIKIDQGFVRRMLEDAYSRQIVSTVIGVAGSLNAEVIAEGVETAAERDALLAMGCRIGQGFYYSMPLESEDFRWLLEQRSRLPLAQARGDR